MKKSDILKIARKRNDLGTYDEDCLIEFVNHELGNNRNDIDEILDDFSYLDRKEDLFDELNGFLFSSNIEIEDQIDKHIRKKFGTVFYENFGTSKQEIASEFIDQKELYDIDYIVDGEIVDFSEGF